MPTGVAEPKEKQRLNFDFAPDRVDELKQMSVEAGCSMKDLFNNALTILEWSITETRKGNEIAAVNEANQSFRVLVTPLLERVKKSRRQTEARPLNLHASAS